MVKTFTKENLSIQYKELYYLLKIIYFSSILLFFVSFSYVIWVLVQSPGDFSVEIASLNDKTVGLIALHNSNTILFKNIITHTFLEHLKLAYFLKVLLSSSSIIFFIIILKITINITKSISSSGVPYTDYIRKSIRKIGIIIILYGLFQEAAVPLIFSLCKLSDYTLNLFDPPSFTIGILLLYLSYIFSYGETLQKESDETL